MTRLLHISDTHFGTVQPAVRQALLQMSREASADVLVLSGDITQRARPAQFREARAFCDQLGIPLRLSIPGNHDISLLNPFKRLFNPYGDYSREFGDDLEPLLRTPGLCVIGVRTTRRFRHKNGQVSGDQIDQVASQLREAPAGDLRIVVVHQPVHAVRAEDAHDGLRNRAAAVRAWAEAGADIVLGGHIHLPYVADLSHSYSIGRRLWCVQAGTALSSRVRWEAPNSVNLLKHDAGDVFCDVERWDYRLAQAGDSNYSLNAPTGAFRMAQVTRLWLDR